MAQKILIVEDEVNIAELLHLYLEKEGYETQTAPDGGKAVELFRSFAPDLVLLDIMLPVMDGWSVLKKIRAESKTPVIMLTAKGETGDKVTGLEQGADDYIVKPFGVPEVLARIRTTLRHAERVRSATHGEKKLSYRVKDLTVDTARHQVFVGEKEIHLTQNEFKILELLCLHAGKVLTYDFIMKEVWGPYTTGGNQILRVNMANIRRKLGENPSEPKYVLTELGIGYRLLEEG